MAKTSTTPKTSAVPSSQDLNRLAVTSAQEGNQASTNLALLEAENTQAAGAAAPSPTQVANPSVQRIASHRWEGYTGQLNAAQRAEDQADVWVTVPVDKVTVAPNGSQGIAPVYATPKGYQARPGESVGSIPPPMGVRR